MREQSILDISWATIFKISIAVITLYFVYLLKDIIIWIIFALIIAILFNFPIDYLEKKKIPRIVSASLLYFGIFALISWFFYETAPIFLAEIENFIHNFPLQLSKISPLLEKMGLGAINANANLINFTKESLKGAQGGILNAFSAIFGGFYSAIFIVFLAFFISLEKNVGERIVEFFSPAQYKFYFGELWKKAKKKIGGWFISKLIGALFVGTATFAALAILNVKYSFIFSLLAGVLDLIPFIGPLIVGLVATAVIWLSSPTQAIFALTAFIIIQLLENDLVLPIIYRRAVDLSPVLVLIALAIGGELWGVLGAILAIPLTGIIFEILKDYFAGKIKMEPKEEVIGDDIEDDIIV